MRLTRWHVGIGAGLLAALWLVNRKRGVSPLLASPQRILLLGDSLAYGMSPSFANLAKRDGHEFFSKVCPIGATGGAACTCIVGSSTVQWSRDNWIGGALDAARPSLVLISLGTNDFQGGKAYRPTVAAAARKIVDKVTEAGAKAVWIQPLAMPFSDSADAQGAWRESGAKIVAGSGMSFERAPDRIHLTPNGYRAWSESIWSALSGEGGVV